MGRYVSKSVVLYEGIEFPLYCIIVTPKGDVILPNYPRWGYHWHGYRDKYGKPGAVITKETKNHKDKIHTQTSITLGDIQNIRIDCLQKRYPKYFKKVV